MSSGFAAIANKILLKAGFQIVRKNTLDRLVSNDYLYCEMLKASATNTSVATDMAESINLGTYSALEKRVAELESYSPDQSIRNVIRYSMKAHWRAIDLIEKVTGSDKPECCKLCGCEVGSEGFREVVSECMFLGGKLVRHVCPNCEVIFGPQKMFALDDEMLDLDYKNLYRVYSEGNSTESIIRTFHLLNPKKDGVYLDFGCGGEWSEAIQKLRNEGWNIYGFEPSATHSSEHVFSTWAEVEARTFDGIFSHNVLEHLFDPAATTRKLGDLLSQGGSIVHATPCYDYKYEFTHFHVFFFTGKSPEVLAENAGMQITNRVRDGEFIACTFQKKPA